MTTSRARSGPGELPTGILNPMATLEEWYPHHSNRHIEDKGTEAGSM
jgi:hypothetical protein